MSAAPPGRLHGAPCPKPLPVCRCMALPCRMTARVLLPGSRRPVAAAAHPRRAAPVRCSKCLQVLQYMLRVVPTGRRTALDAGLLPALRWVVGVYGGR